jgi:hypothetical protein
MDEALPNYYTAYKFYDIIAEKNSKAKYNLGYMQ